MTAAFAPAGLPSAVADTAERARKAVAAANKMLPQWQAFARVVSRKPKLRIHLTSGAPMTDGESIWLMVPLELADLGDHVRSLCGERDEDYQLRCPACNVEELVNSDVYHELAHMVYESFAPVTETERQLAFQRAVDQRGIMDKNSPIAKNLQRLVDTMPEDIDYFTISKLSSPYLPFLLNCIEDTRVNTAMMRDRPGTIKMFRSSMFKVMALGMEKPDGSRTDWSKVDRNSQAMLSIHCESSFFDPRPYLIPEIAPMLDDPRMAQLVDRVRAANSALEVYRISFPMLSIMQEYGFCLNVGDDLPSPPPPPQEAQDEPQDQADDESEDDDSSQEGGDSGESGSDAEDDNPSADGGEDAGDGGAGDDDPSDQDDSSGSAADDAGDASYGDDPQDQPSGEGEDSGDADGGQPDGAGQPDGSGGSPDDSPMEDSPGGESEGEPSKGGDGSGDSSEPGGEGSPDSSGVETESGSTDDQNQGEISPETDVSPGDGPSAPTGPTAPETGQNPAMAGQEPQPAPGPGQPGIGTPTNQDHAGGSTALQDSPAPLPDSSHADDEPVPTYTQEDMDRDGTPEAVKEAFDQFARHIDKDPADLTPEQQALTELIKLVLIQLPIFDQLSLRVGGVQVIRREEQRGGWEDANKPSELVVIPEAILQPSLARLRVAFTNNQRSVVERHLQSGKIDTRVLGKRISTGDARVFRKKIIPGKRDYAVVIGGDVSGSTSYFPRIQLIKGSMIATGELFHRLGIRFLMAAHTGIEGAVSGHDVAVMMCKEFHEPWDNKARQAVSDLHPSDANLDGHTLEFYRKRIQKEQATDKIIFYFTDGAMPAANFNEELEILQRELAICQRLGITVIGVGIQTDSPNQHGLDTIILNRIEDIPHMVEETARRIA